MQDLTLVGVHDDGEHLVLTAPGGQRFRVRVDDALRAAVRRDRPRLGQLQIEMDGRLRPKDIQARIRAGHPAEEVAAAAGLPIEHVRRYEGPVLAERAHIAIQAQKQPLRHTPGAPSPTLADVVADRLVRREVDPERAAWDSWRCDDGQWTVQVVFTAGSRARLARWSFDPHVRHLAPLDDEARWLTEVEREDVGPVPQRRLSSVLGHSDGVDPGRVDDVLDVVDVPGLDDDRPDPPTTTIELLDTLRERRGRRGHAVPPDEDEAAAGDPLDDLLGNLLSRTEVLDGSQAPGEPLNDPGPNHPARRAAARPDARQVIELPDDGFVSPAVPNDSVPDVSVPNAAVPNAAGTTPAADPTVGAQYSPESAEQRSAEPEAAAPGDPPAARKTRRASVPSWDDIVFGARRE